MWPTLRESAARLTAYIVSDAHEAGGEVPGKTFTATPGFFELQTGDGPLTQSFEIGGIKSRRMVVPYQIWMLGRIERVLAPILAQTQGKETLAAFLETWDGGEDLLDLEGLLAGCRVEKRNSLLFSAVP